MNILHRSATVAAALALAVISSSLARADSFSYASVSSTTNTSLNSYANFTYDSNTNVSTFNFLPTTGPDFTITSGAANGLQGTITGTFQIGTINTIIPNFLYSAAVTTVGNTPAQITITDALNNVLTANLTWDTITQLGTSDTLNVGGSINLTNVTYSGNNAALLALKSAGAGSDTLDLTFNPARTLDYIAHNNLTTSFSGSISTAPDAGATALLIVLGSVGLGLGFIAKRRSVGSV